ncbi:MbtH family protein [Streptomyces sp. NBC_00094]|uniref:MbtH family protein n=1 Tax=Streptomyces sp. NBC_00094 TaxID=2903620 RepID=UPI0022572C0E|nr:MbtH family protein [Streptomyces sp. NBC_00094]MCX5391996.1 MbtH family protein [Streptomyces sp. NBC_00094]
MDTNPFEDENGTYVVLINDEGQHSLWPSRTAVPAGWTVTFGPDTRQAALAHTESTWTDLKPRSLAATYR